MAEEEGMRVPLDRAIEWGLLIHELAERDPDKALRLVRQQHRAGELSDDVAAMLSEAIEARRGRTRLSSSGIATSDDYDRVKRVLINFFFEMIGLPIETREQLVADLAVVACLARGGIDAGKPHKANTACSKHIFMRDVRGSFERAGLPVNRWEHHAEGGGESLYFEVAHALGAAFDLDLPQDLEPLAKQAAKIKHGEISRAMKAAQRAEFPALWRRQAGVWGYTLVDAPRSYEELASAYLGFPF